MRLLLPAIVLAVGLAALVTTFRFGKKRYPQIDVELTDALERAKTSPSGVVSAGTLPLAAAFLAGLMVGFALVAVGLLWLIAALLL